MVKIRGKTTLSASFSCKQGGVDASDFQKMLLDRSRKQIGGLWGRGQHLVQVVDTNPVAVSVPFLTSLPDLVHVS